MEVSLINKIFNSHIGKRRTKTGISTNYNLTSANINHTYLIKAIETGDEEMKNFLFSLGCFEGENITVISVLADNYIINIKNSRYSIDVDLAKAIII